MMVCSDRTGLIVEQKLKVFNDRIKPRARPYMSAGFGFYQAWKLTLDPMYLV